MISVTPEIAREIAELRKETLWTQRDLAQEISAPRSVIENLETGRLKTIEADRLEAIRAALARAPKRPILTGFANSRTPEVSYRAAFQYPGIDFAELAHGNPKTVELILAWFDRQADKVLEAVRASPPPVRPKSQRSKGNG